MIKNDLSLEEHIRGLKIMHFALALGPIIQMVLLHFVIEPVNFEGISEPLNTMGYAFVGFGCLMGILSFFMFNKKMEGINHPHTLQNIASVRKAYILKWACLEAGILVNLIIYFIIYSHPLLILTSVCLLFVLMLSPYKA